MQVLTHTGACVLFLGDDFDTFLGYVLLYSIKINNFIFINYKMIIFFNLSR